MKNNPAVDKLIERLTAWRNETIALRKILLEAGLQEEIRWGKPCYQSEGKNICVIQGFKNYFALLFMQGFLLPDPTNMLEKTGPNTRVGRQAVFENVAQIKARKPALKDLLAAAIKIEKTGIKTPRAPKTKTELPVELKKIFSVDSTLKKSFEAMTPGRQRSIVLFISSAKQAATRESRAEKARGMILEGRGWNER